MQASCQAPASVCASDGLGRTLASVVAWLLQRCSQCCTVGLCVSVYLSICLWVSVCVCVLLAWIHWRHADDVCCYTATQTVCSLSEHYVQTEDRQDTPSIAIAAMDSTHETVGYTAIADARVFYSIIPSSLHALLLYLHHAHHLDSLLPYIRGAGLETGGGAKCSL